MADKKVPLAALVGGPIGWVVRSKKKRAAA